MRHACNVHACLMREPQTGVTTMEPRHEKLLGVKPEVTLQEQPASEQHRDESIKRLDAMRSITIDKKAEEEKQREIKKQEQEEAKKRMVVEKRERLLTENGMKDLIPFYIKDANVYSRNWWVFSVPGYCTLYVSIDPKERPGILIRFSDADDRWSNGYYTLGEALIDAKL